MAVNVLKLKKRAVELGMSKDDAKKADRPALESFIANAGLEDDSPKKPAKKKPAKSSGASATKKKAGSKKKKSAGEITAKKSASKKSVPAEKKSEKKSGKAKRPTAQKKNADTNGTGRVAIGSLDFTKTSDEWNPKKGGPVERLFKALKKSRGDVDKAFELVKSDVWDYVGKKHRNGEKRSKSSAEAMLKYRLNRTKFEYALRTGQHQSATERVEYGTGQYASTRRKKGKKKDAENTDKKKPRNGPSKKQARKASTTSKRKPGTKKTSSKKKSGSKK